MFHRVCYVIFFRRHRQAFAHVFPGPKKVEDTTTTHAAAAAPGSPFNCACVPTLNMLLKKLLKAVFEEVSFGVV